MNAFISLGSNKGDRSASLTEAKRRLAGLPQSSLVATSALYESEPVDCPPGTRPFCNAVVQLETALVPLALLDALQAIEVAMGRAPTRPKNVPRLIDLDLLLCDHEIIRTDRLTVPHPLMCERLFVLLPLAELSPDLVVPGRERKVRELLDAGRDSHWIKQLAGSW